ncbi:uncharacterized protein A1O5_08795 [Cladophialophora psammophila CBS 110553]|uniref:DUF6606 domain-containing protein n=1 Tax=Cladophialophora psammophila CBS 110553 TaxID=1182543 RepID=W9WT24_9EURO|nr:uncharacterized protein A1O5_08795 [Cladophialophora psammophila CBS 110553]EXJ68180.1 hypothetical protein A1O5_08795 [Cladophialophora psammophila CBS 110553]
MATSSAKLLCAIVNHLVLPPDLPDNVDKNLAEVNHELLQRVQNACRELDSAIKGEFQQELRLLQSSLAHSCNYSEHFVDWQVDEILIVHVSEQNTGLLVRHGTSELKEYIIFEAFKVSAKSENVLESLGALQWDFPTSAAAIPNKVFADESFQQSLAEFLQKASFERVGKFGATILRVKSPTPEARDTNNPALITGLLITLLEGLSQLATTSPIRKRVRDEVRWKDSGIPWRRSPFWLRLRVGILRHLEQLTCPSVSIAMYKALMCLLHAQLLGPVAGSQAPELAHLLFRKLGRRIAKLEKDGALAAAADIRISVAYPQSPRFRRIPACVNSAPWETE